jgi:hypothetical protein
VTVVFCGVAGDSTNVDPVPAVDRAGRFDYVPIPEKCETAETATYGRLPCRHGDGVLADRLDRIYTREGAWSDDTGRIRSHPVHHDPNFDRLTYGEHRPGYVNRLRELGPGDAVAFYSGLRHPDDGYLNRYLLGWLAVDRVDVVDPDADPDERAAVLEAHPHNAHTKRFRARGRLYYDAKPVVLVAGAAGGRLDRAIRLTEWRDWFYCRPSVERALFPDVDPADGPVGLGSRKPARSSSLDVDGFRAAVDRLDRGTDLGRGRDGR